MSYINVKESDYVRFHIKSPIYGRIKMDIEPGGWDDSNLKLVRTIEHGIFTQYTGSLKFYDEHRDIIENTFKSLGNNSSLYLIKEELRDNGDDVVWTVTYQGRADWESKSIKNGVLQINFNSNDLEEKIEAHESDEFSIETRTSIDDEDIGFLEKQKVDIEGRELFSYGKSVLLKDNPGDTYNIRNVNQFGNQTRGVFFKSEIISYGHDRFVSVDSNYYDRFPEPTSSELESYGIEATHMFMVDSTAIEQTITVNVKIQEETRVRYSGGYEYPVTHRARLVKLKRTWSPELDSNFYDVVQTWELTNVNVHLIENQENISYVDFESDIDLEWDEGLAIWHQLFYIMDGQLSTTALGTVYDSNNSWGMFDPRKQDIQVVVKTYQPPSIDLSCVFVHDVFDRLIKIITGKSNLFYSKCFGRTESGYQNDGEYGLIGLISGYWVRAFNPESNRYKSPVFSWKKLLESCNSVFNVGFGTEIINGLKRVRIEKVKYFYQNKIVIDLGYVENIEKKYDKDLYFSGLEIGYNKGGDYENAYGLDEPNILSNFVTPDRKSTNKYRKISDIRADETGLELARRKPEIDFPDEDTSYDNHNWFLDLKRGYNKFMQRPYTDRLQEIPTGINAPTNFKSFFFTPLRILLRHGFIIRSGIENYLSKKIKWISSSANSKLGMHYIGEDEELFEDLPDGLLVSKLERSLFLPEKITFEKELTQELLDLIYGKTNQLYEGSYENIPNYYFKFRWIDENGENQTGYLLEFEPTKRAKFKMQLANNNKI